MSEGSDRAQGRRTPYELVFGSEEFETRLFPGIRAEAEERGVDVRNAERFGFLSLVGDAVRGVVPDEMPPEALEQYRALFHQAFNFWSFGKRLYVVEPAIARYLVEAAPRMEAWEMALPYPAVYVQLPTNLFWGSITPDTPPEPVDGFFATAADETDAAGRPYRRIEVLAVLGIRRDRAGFSVIALSTGSGAGIAPVWADAPGRETGHDFENILPGGELSGLYSITTTTEALKILARVLWYIDTFPEDVLPGAHAEPLAGDPAAPAPASRISYRRVTLGDRIAGT